MLEIGKKMSDINHQRILAEEIAAEVSLYATESC